MALYKLGCGNFVHVDDDVTAENALERIRGQLLALDGDDVHSDRRRAKTVDRIKVKLQRLAEAASNGAVTAGEFEGDAAELEEWVTAAEADHQANARFTSAARSRLEADRAELKANGVRHQCPVCQQLQADLAPATEADTAKPGAGCRVGTPGASKGGK